MTGSNWPLELRVPETRDAMLVRYADGTNHRLAAEYLRVFTPSAERVGHGGARTLIGGKEAVRIADVSAVGRYAVRITFDDGHNTGIYPLNTLHSLFADYETAWETYLQELEAHGLSRDRAGTAQVPRDAKLT